jgi:hypothetical protein
VQEDFGAADDLYISFLLRLNALPSADVRLVLISNAGTTVGNLVVRAGGALRLRNGTATIGSDSASLEVGKLYRIGIRQRRGNGSNALLQAYLAADGGSFGAPFASLASGTWQTAADRLRVGATISTALDAIVDDIRLDKTTMP